MFLLFLDEHWLFTYGNYTDLFWIQVVVISWSLLAIARLSCSGFASVKKTYSFHKEKPIITMIERGIVIQK